MLSRADLSLRSANAHQQTTLMLAAIHGRISLVHRLITMHKAPVNQQDAEGSTALMAAAEHNRSNVVRLLLSQPNVDANLRDNASDLVSVVYRHEFCY
ncbi:unnamed protein product [Echinostoma caproni]|uniref:ANK_REP_REGION domain-containing protein n=1 Tax=Echinostoma caproni TaxID=27848 RepID=A0A183B689_9TREM|nr:unnamed protein product [Echinostoma caproni]